MKKFTIVLINVIFISVSLMALERVELSRDYVKDVLKKISEGDRDVLRDISYTNLEYILDYSRGSQGVIYLGKRNKAVNSALKGLFNKDPRVRLICIEILRLSKPDRLMEPEVELAYERETVYLLKGGKDRPLKYTDYYSYRNLFGKKSKRSVLEETTKIYRFVLRDKYVYLLLEKENDLLSYIKKEDFFILSRRIAHEKRETIPLQSVGHKRVFKPESLWIVIKGLDNPNTMVKQGCARYLVAYYNTNAYQMDAHTRSQVLKALKRAYDNDVIAKPRLIKVRRR